MSEGSLAKKWCVKRVHKHWPATCAFHLYSMLISNQSVTMENWAGFDCVLIGWGATCLIVFFPELTSYVLKPHFNSNISYGVFMNIGSKSAATVAIRYLKKFVAPGAFINACMLQDSWI